MNVPTTIMPIIIPTIAAVLSPLLVLTNMVTIAFQEGEIAYTMQRVPGVNVNEEPHLKSAFFREF